MGKKIFSDRRISWMEKSLKQLGDMAVKVSHDIQQENKDIMKESADINADINYDAIKKTAQAVKEGLEAETLYCKYCGKTIDADSIYCKYCGKKLSEQ